jgi:hypothetical protein
MSAAIPLAGRRSWCNHPDEARFARRRLTALLGISVFLLALMFGAGSVLANRGGAPASTPAVRPATSPVVQLPGAPYIVQPGDTLWSIAIAHRGGSSQREYVDRLIERIGGTSLQIGQLLSLP